MRAGISNIKGNLYTGGWQLIYENLLTSAATSVTISGLDGNTDKEYRLVYRGIGNGGNAAHFLTINGDTGTNYGYQSVDGLNTTVNAYRNTGNAIFFDVETGLETGQIMFSEMLIYAKSGYPRTVLVKTADKISTTTVTVSLLGGWSWNNTADNITSLTVSSQVANGMGIGSHILLFARRIKQTTQLEGSLELYKGKLQAGVMQTIYETTLTEAATSITISGLDGNTDILYELEMRIVNPLSGTTSYKTRFNADGGQTYGNQVLKGENATVTAIRNTDGSNRYSIDWCESAVQNSYQQVNALLYAKSGYLRTLISKSSYSISTTTVTGINIRGQVWTNTADNLTSMSIFADGANGLGIGTYIRLKALRKVL